MSSSSKSLPSEASSLNSSESWISRRRFRRPRPRAGAAIAWHLSQSSGTTVNAVKSRASAHICHETSRYAARIIGHWVPLKNDNSSPETTHHSHTQVPPPPQSTLGVRMRWKDASLLGAVWMCKDGSTGKDAAVPWVTPFPLPHGSVCSRSEPPGAQQSHALQRETNIFVAAALPFVLAGHDSYKSRNERGRERQCKLLQPQLEKETTT
eukprot:3636164-Pyramimonas_sp.AAC.1